MLKGEALQRGEGKGRQRAGQAAALQVQLDEGGGQGEGEGEVAGERVAGEEEGREEQGLGEELGGEGAREGVVGEVKVEAGRSRGAAKGQVGGDGTGQAVVACRGDGEVGERGGVCGEGEGLPSESCVSWGKLEKGKSSRSPHRSLEVRSMALRAVALPSSGGMAADRRLELRSRAVREERFPR